MNSEKYFRIIQINNINKKFGNVCVKKESSPINAATKLFKLLLKKNNQSNLKKEVILIQEINQNSSKNIYGPYTGLFEKNKLVNVKKSKSFINNKNKTIKSKTNNLLKKYIKNINQKVIRKMKGGKFITNNSLSINRLYNSVNHIHKNKNKKVKQRNNFNKKIVESKLLNIQVKFNSEVEKEKYLKTKMENRYKPCMKFFASLLVKNILDFPIDKSIIGLKRIELKTEYSTQNLLYLYRLLSLIQDKCDDNFDNIKKILFDNNSNNNEKDISIIIDKSRKIGFNIKNKDIFFVANNEDSIVADVYKSLYFDHLIENLDISIKNTLVDLYVVKTGTIASSCLTENHFKVDIESTANFLLPGTGNPNSWINRERKRRTVCAYSERFFSEYKPTEEVNTGIIKNIILLNPDDKSKYKRIICHIDKKFNIKNNTTIKYNKSIPKIIGISRKTLNLSRLIGKKNSKSSLFNTRGNQLKNFSNKSYKNYLITKLFPNLWAAQYEALTFTPGYPLIGNLINATRGNNGKDRGMSFGSLYFNNSDWIFFTLLQTLNKKPQNFKEEENSKPYYYVGKLDDKLNPINPYYIPINITKESKEKNNSNPNSNPNPKPNPNTNDIPITVTAPGTLIPPSYNKNILNDNRRDVYLTAQGFFRLDNEKEWYAIPSYEEKNNSYYVEKIQEQGKLGFKFKHEEPTLSKTGMTWEGRWSNY